MVLYEHGLVPGQSYAAELTRVLFLLKVVTVEDFINSVDFQMRQRQDQQKLATISARIDSYEAVEGSSEEVEKARNDL